MDLMGGSSIVWIHQHNVGHHPNSNRQGDSCKSECDQDDPDARSGTPIVRITPAQPLMWWHKWQHYYIWFLFLMVTSKWYVNDMRTFVRRKYININLFKLNSSEYYLLAMTKLLFLLYMVLVPFSLHNPWRAAAITCVFMGTTSYYFVLMFSVNHLTEDSCFPGEGMDNRDWATLQVLTSSNFAVGSELWTWLSGGLNYQIEHHLFPGLCHVYLPYISPIVQQTCKEYNIPYVSFRSYGDAIYSHYIHLKLLGNPELAAEKKLQ
jgi:linoleoyl-CoA desaturase